VDGAASGPPRSTSGLDKIAAMPLLWIGLLLVLLKWLEVGLFANVSWWWILVPLAGAVAWFEVLERLFGRDRRQVEAADWAKRREHRLARQFERLRWRR